MVFKNYDGEEISVLPHTHPITDTLNEEGEIAIATQHNDGFMSSADYNRMQTLKAKIDKLEDQMNKAVFVNVPK